MGPPVSSLSDDHKESTAPDQLASLSLSSANAIASNSVRMFSAAPSGSPSSSFDAPCDLSPAPDIAATRCKCHCIYKICQSGRGRPVGSSVLIVIKSPDWITRSVTVSYNLTRLPGPTSLTESVGLSVSNTVLVAFVADSQKNWIVSSFSETLTGFKANKALPKKRCAQGQRHIMFLGQSPSPPLTALRQFSTVSWDQKYVSICQKRNDSPRSLRACREKGKMWATSTSSLFVTTHPSQSRSRH